MAELMRLLRCSDTGDFGLPEAFAGHKTIPPYAILSHTWEEGQEITFEDLVNGTGKDKTGCDKIRHCSRQAKRDGLQYFWVDTCCIDKSNPAELQKAINSMFRWYRNAKKCYVYLQDVSTMKRKASDGAFEYTWEPTFRQSRWFRRGWTLQELIAPSSVEFFSREWQKLGDKHLLTQQIREVTVIPETALKGTAMFRFSAEERFSWIQSRETTEKEDKAYALLGIFDIEMPLCYREGYATAFKRLQKEISKLKTCLQDLHLTDPRRDKKRIEDTKGGLLLDSYRWILEHPDFQQWQGESQSRLLWIKGDPGKGKTMLLCGIINELEKSTAETTLISYFFCQATDSRINSATAVLRGLLFTLVRQQPSFFSHMREKYDQVGKALFEDANAWVALSEIFMSIVQDPSLKITYLILDALDECVTDLPNLLDFIVQISSTSSSVKWIMSSRNWPNIEERLERAEDKVRLSLELNAESVSAAVYSYINYRVSQLARVKNFSNQTKQAVLDYIHTNANDTFLWAALVCQNLGNMSRLNIVTKLKAFPPGLDSLYERMVQNINDLEDAGLCRQVLGIVSAVYRPITLHELDSLMEELDGTGEDLDSAREIVSLCGSLLTIRDGTIYFVHQSVKDFLLKEATNTIFPSGGEVVHYTIFCRSLLAMSKTLRRDLYGLGVLGYPIEQIHQPDPDPLAASRYSCIYWVDHLCDSILGSVTNNREFLQDRGIVDVFLRTKYLYWLEALSLCQSVSKGVVSMAKLAALVQSRENAQSLVGLVQDAYRFIMYFKVAIESAPLQAYASGLLFSPKRSLAKTLFQEEAPNWITIAPYVADDWSACLQTLEGHSMAFSPDSQRLASASHDKTAKIWDSTSGKCLQIISVDTSLHSIAFNADSSSLHTDIGTIAVNAPMALSSLNMTDITIAEQPYSDKVWITYNSRNIVWLPPEYRPSVSAVSGTRIGIGVGTGRVWMFSVNFQE
ncbi:HET-domain-containing protein [Corynespora cassiicola Philippines]|uniref:HET-domain-containing protein n=1 Tax=Corynespora cassiicola Philippines TaxID=1448308 RepID=A0A2T2N1A6_CORCC|nr:HET-domain-containing protein [Corynespora cassiicola Philippines]